MNKKRTPRPAYVTTNKRRLVLAFLDSEAHNAIKATLLAMVAADTLALQDMPRAKALDGLRKTTGFDGGTYLAKTLKRRVASNLAILEAFD